MYILLGLFLFTSCETTAPCECDNGSNGFIEGTEQSINIGSESTAKRTLKPHPEPNIVPHSKEQDQKIKKTIRTTSSYYPFVGQLCCRCGTGVVYIYESP